MGFGEGERRSVVEGEGDIKRMLRGIAVTGVGEGGDR